MVGVGWSECAGCGSVVALECCWCGLRRCQLLRGFACRLQSLRSTVSYVSTTIYSTAYLWNVRLHVRCGAVGCMECCADCAVCTSRVQSVSHSVISLVCVADSTLPTYPFLP